MKIINVEIKAKCYDPQNVRIILSELNARFSGMDHQVDTYFRVSNGRLKLREGNIENGLIYYARDNVSGPKKSDCLVYRTEQTNELKEILTKFLRILVVVDKKREIYYIDNVKIHVDYVKGLGNFIEIEAQDKTGEYSENELFKQCKTLMLKFKINKKDLISNSYSDMILDIQGKNKKTIF